MKIKFLGGLPHRNRIHVARLPQDRAYNSNHFAADQVFVSEPTLQRHTLSPLTENRSGALNDKIDGDSNTIDLITFQGLILLFMARVCRIQ